MIGITDYILPAHYQKYCIRKGKPYRPLMVTGWLVVIALTIHNIPEGVAVLFSTVGDSVFGLLLALATAIHNIPEGLAIAAPIYASTGKKSTALLYTAIAGLAEPVGAIICYFAFQQYITQQTIYYVFALVSGIMVYISFDELLPSCLSQGEDHTAVAGIMTGMAALAVSLYFLH